MTQERLPHLAMIAAQAKGRVIGFQNRMPWHVPEDLKFFKEKTLGHTIIMGHNTLLSLGRTLPKRKNVVITSASPESLAHFGELTVVPNVEEALAIAREVSHVMIIGGGQTYRDFLPYASTIYLTELDTVVEGDVTFPELDKAHWKGTCLKTLPATPERPFEVCFNCYQFVNK